MTKTKTTKDEVSKNTGIADPEMAKRQEVLKELQGVLEKHNASLLPILVREPSSTRADVVLVFNEEAKGEAETNTTEDAKPDTSN